MAINVSTVAAPPPAPPFTTAPQSADFDDKWGAWLAKGAAHDRAVRRKIAVVAPILIIITIIVYALLGR